MSAVPSPRAVLLRRWLPGVLACALAAALYAGLALVHLRIAPRQDRAAEPYNELVRGFEAGHLYLPTEVPAGFQQLSDPWDPAMTPSPEEFRDKSYYRGRLYLYFGVTPALLIFWPWHLLTGHFAAQGPVVAALCIAGYLAGAVLLLALWRRRFAEVPAWVAAGAALVLGTATTVPLLVARPEVWEVPIGCAYALSLLALGAAWLSWVRPSFRERLGWLSLAGLAAGLAVGARPALLFAMTALAAGAALLGPSATSGRRLGRLMAAFGPLALVGLGLATYNQARFGDALQFGQHYQLTGDNVHSRTVFSPAFVLENLRLYLLSPLRWGPRFPFAWLPAIPSLSPAHGDVEDVVGLLPTLPVLLLALAAPLAWRGREASEKALLRGFAVLLTGVFLPSAAVVLFFYGSCNRYEVDFLPGLALLACLGLLGTDRVAAAWVPVARLAWRAAAAALIAYSAASIILCSVARSAFSGWAEAAESQRGRPTPQTRMEAVRVGWRMVGVSNGYDGYPNLGMAQFENGQRADALLSLAEGFRLRPDIFRVEFNLAQAQIACHETQRGFQTFQDAFRRHPTGHISQKAKAGLILASVGSYRDALPFLKEAVAAYPSVGALQGALGESLLETDSPAAALPSLREAVRLGPPSAGLLNCLGVALSKTGAGGEAAACFRQALSLDPKLELARQNLAAVLGGRGQ